MSNLLEKECSLYLLQHKSNPVNWFAWGNEAFDKAKIEKKPVFASIGYSSCHWCHVMAHESFENPAIAKLLNENFVSIKVDREEFPDIDSFYMEFLAQNSGYGGWPLNVFLNSKKNPLFGISYLPIPRFAKLLEEISAKYAERESVREMELENNFSMKKISEIDGKKFFEDARELQLHGESGPKFPMALALLFELEKRGKISQKIFAELENLALKGLFDHVEGGWFRYSVDAEWKIPHFEKMLYDQAALLLLCGKAFELSKNEMFKIAILNTIEWLEFHMKLESGLYGSATDADTVEGEGFYYTVSKHQNETVSKLFRLDLCGEHDGRLVPWLDLEFFQKNRIECEKQVELLKLERKKLHFPNLDSKAVVSWNCFLGYSLLKCAKALNDEKIGKMAVGLFEKISKFYENGKLCHAIYGMKKFESNEYLQDYSAFLLFSSEIAKTKPDAGKLCNELIELIEKKFFVGGNIAGTSEKTFDNFSLWQDLPFPSGASMLFNALINLNSEKIGKFSENFFGVLEFASNSPEFFGFWLYGFEKYFKGQ